MTRESNDSVVVELVDVVKRFREVTAVDHVSLQIPEGEFFSLLGPSGCGKTTTLRLIAGFEVPTAGKILIRGAEQGFRPAYQRPVNTVFQHYALFPHMNVYKNVAFGLEMQGIPETEVRARVAEALELVRLSGLERRQPRQLSGGQQQRVALARALVNHPKVLLLDEPLGALDLKLRKAMQDELKALQSQVGITFIYVTHDQEEALTMSDRIAVMNHGRVQQVATPEEIYEHPSNRFVADFIGETNFLAALVETSGPPIGLRIAAHPAWAASASLDVQAGERAMISIRPERVQIRVPLRREADANATLETRLPGVVDQKIYMGTDTRYIVRLADGEQVVARVQNTAPDAGRFEIGEPVEVVWAAQHARVLKD